MQMSQIFYRRCKRCKGVGRVRIYVSSNYYKTEQCESCKGLGKFVAERSFKKRIKIRQSSEYISVIRFLQYNSSKDQTWTVSDLVSVFDNINRNTIIGCCAAAVRHNHVKYDYKDGCLNIWINND